MVVTPNSNMKICMVVTAPIPGSGGDSVNIINRCKAIRKCGAEVHLVTYGDSGRKEPDIEEGIKIHRTRYICLPYLNFVADMLLNPLRLATKAHNVAQKYPVQLFHVRHPYVALAMLFVNKISKRKPVVLEAAIMSVEMVDKGLSPHSSKVKIMRTVESVGFKLANMIIAPSSGVTEVVKQYVSEEKVRIVSFAVDEEKFKPNLSTAQEKREEKIILYVGGLQKWQGIDFMLMSFAMVCQQMSDVTLHIVTTNPDIKIYKNVARELTIGHKVKFYSLPHSEIPNTMRQATVFIIPRPKIKTTEIAVPVKLLEAMASGLPVVATDVAGVRELMDANATFLMAEPNNPTDFSQKILSVLSDKELSKKIAKNARDKIEKDCSLRGVGKKLLSVYQELIKMKAV